VLKDFTPHTLSAEDSYGPEVVSVNNDVGFDFADFNSILKVRNSCFFSIYASSLNPFSASAADH